MNNLQLPIARKDGLVIQEMPDEVLVYDLNTNKAHCLNQTAAFVWRACDGTKSVGEINALMEKEFGGNVKEEMVWLAIDLLNKDNLLEENITTKFNGLSRREVIKKVGLTTAVALPVVAMLSFPKVALGVTCPVSICGFFGGSGCDFCCRGTCQATACPPNCAPQGRSTRIEIKKN
jgi:hypothetical protein